MNKIIKSLSIVSLIVMPVLYLGFVPAQASEQGHWVQKNSGKWYFYYTDGTYAMATVIDGKYYVYWTGVWDGKTLATNSSTKQQIDYSTQAVNYNTQETNYNTQVSKDNSEATTTTITYAEFTKVADDKMLELINAHRQSNGVSPLKWDQILANTSTEKSAHMVKHNYMGHSYKNSATIDVQEVCYGHNIDSENCLANYSYAITDSGAIVLAESMFNQWKDSPEHNKNMLNPDWRNFGFGFAFSHGEAQYASYGTQQFATGHNGYEEHKTLGRNVPHSLADFN